MKDRFIISRRIICSRRYLMLSASAQSLYIALNADADDDGIVEAYAVMLRQRAVETDLIQLLDADISVLLSKKDMIVWLRDWLVMNLNRDLRYIHPSKYRTLLAEIVPDAEVMVATLNANGKRTKRILNVQQALSIIDINSSNLSTRGISMHKTSASQDKYITCLDLPNKYICPTCDGKGTVDNLPCETCHGTGLIQYYKKEKSK